MTNEETLIFEHGDVVYGDDPFERDEDAQPWLVLSKHRARQFYDDQYIALTSTAKSWLDSLIEILEESWIRG